MVLLSARPIHGSDHIHVRPHAARQDLRGYEPSLRHKEDPPVRSIMHRASQGRAQGRAQRLPRSHGLHLNLKKHLWSTSRSLHFGETFRERSTSSLRLPSGQSDSPPRSTPSKDRVYHPPPATCQWSRSCLSASYQHNGSGEDQLRAARLVPPSASRQSLSPGCRCPIDLQLCSSGGRSASTWIHADSRPARSLPALYSVPRTEGYLRSGMRLRPEDDR